MRLVGGFEDIRGIIGKFGNSSGFTGSFGKGSIIIAGGDYPIYDGPTSVVPKANEQTVLNTNEKTLLSNITVFEVPFFEVTNPQGGNTCYIANASELEVT